MIYNQIQGNGISRKYRICEKGRAKSLQEAAMFLASVAAMFIHALLTWIPTKGCFM